MSPACCCGTEIGCDYADDLPESFDVQILQTTNRSCTSCSILTTLISLAYQGTIEGEFGNPGTSEPLEYHHWKSEPDAYSSPGVCGGNFDNRTLHVLVYTGKIPDHTRMDDPCAVWGLLFPDADSPFVDIASSSNSIEAVFQGQLFQDAIERTDDYFDINFTSWISTSDCFPSNVYPDPPTETENARMRLWIPFTGVGP